MFEGLRKPSELIVIVVTLLAYGCPVQAIVKAFGLDERTVARLSRSSRSAVSTRAGSGRAIRQVELDPRASRRDPCQDPSRNPVDGVSIAD